MTLFILSWQISTGQVGDIPWVLDPVQFRRCFVARVAALIGAPEGVIAIDGKAVRRSGDKRRGSAPIHMVSAFAAEQCLVLGQVNGNHPA